jgi:hypothetical protein
MSKTRLDFVLGKRGILKERIPAAADWTSATLKSPRPPL